MIYIYGNQLQLFDMFTLIFVICLNFIEKYMLNSENDLLKVQFVFD